MKSFLLSSLLLCLNMNLAAQTFASTSTDPVYIENVKAGIAAIKAFQYTECLEFYTIAFAIRQTSYISILRAAACAHSTGKTELRDQYLDKAFELSPDGTNGAFKTFEEFTYLQKTPFAEMIKSRLMAAFPEFNERLAIRLAEIRKNDQAQRAFMQGYADKYGWESRQMDSLWDIQSKADYYNTGYITATIDEVGYPGKSIVADQSNTAFLVIQHADLFYQEKYLPILREAAEAGELSWTFLARLIDRIEMRNDRPQVYGSQVSHDKETNEYYFYEIAQPYKIDSIRKTVGLGPIQDRADRWNFTFDPDKHIARHKKE